MNFNKNNLDLSNSPYLIQHKDNPINWQEYSNDVISYAKEQNKPILMSIGYSTCHWCHVMANDTFSNDEIAKFLNENFISIKIDREQRPDIDAFCMAFIQQTTGNGGWPLNIFLTPEIKPFYAVTYVGSTPKYGMPDFLTLIKAVKDFYYKNEGKIEQFKLNGEKLNDFTDDIFKLFEINADKIYGGFGNSMKFPPHCGLIFLLTHPELKNNENMFNFTKKTLDVIINSGLNDHIGGGFYRYCIDRNWNIPHFEKMLYDQAMMIINYSIAYNLIKKEEYKETVKRIVFSLQNSFLNGSLFISSHNADTNHNEGLTYLWSVDELKNVLSNDEFVFFVNNYELIPFEGLYHIKRKNNISTNDNLLNNNILNKLLTFRNTKEQPSKDEKIITSWNALIGISFIFANRYCDLNLNVKNIYDNLMIQENSHSSFNGILQKEFFNEDFSAMFLFATYLYEDSVITIDELNKHFEKINIFKENNNYFENPVDDFVKIPINTFDHPNPSSNTLLKWALSRYEILSDNLPNDNINYLQPFNHDGFNYVVNFVKECVIIKSPEKYDYKNISIHSVQIKSDKKTICSKGVCREIGE